MNDIIREKMNTSSSSSTVNNDKTNISLENKKIDLVQNSNNKFKIIPLSQ